MQASHIHLGINDLTSAVRWLEEVCAVKSDLRIPGKALIPFGGILLVLDSAQGEVAATVAFVVDDCNKKYDELVARGAETLSPPRDFPWGVRTAFVRGPGALTIEIEQSLLCAE
jgi:hypothetical protein